ncbi:MAG TPA: hypothetical protein VIY56_19015 [Vicinamibacterales bacterium]
MIATTLHRRFGQCCLLLILHAAPAQAQDVSATPTFGSVSLSSGFTPDPHVVDIRAGGALNAANTLSSCVGYVASEPDFSLTYEQERYTLSIFAVAATDTTLLVNDPAGTWHCNDDTDDLDNLNPGLHFSSPQSGRYDIWVGNFAAGNNFVNAKLVISEQGTENWRTIVAGLGGGNRALVDVPDRPVVTPPEPEPEPEPVPVPVPTEGAIQYSRKTN